MSRAWPVRWWLFTLSLVVGAPLLLLLAWLFFGELRREQAEARDATLRNLCVLCVSAVNIPLAAAQTFTAETQSAQRLRRGS